MIPGLINNGMLFYPVPADKPIPWISSEDAAQYHVYALSHPELAGQVLLAPGPEALTGAELGDRFTQALGQNVTFHSLNYYDVKDRVVVPDLQLTSLKDWLQQPHVKTMFGS